VTGLWPSVWRTEKRKRWNDTEDEEWATKQPDMCVYACARRGTGLHMSQGKRKTDLQYGIQYLMINEQAALGGNRFLLCVYPYCSSVPTGSSQVIATSTASGPINELFCLYS